MCSVLPADCFAGRGFAAGFCWPAIRNGASNNITQESRFIALAAFQSFDSLSCVEAQKRASFFKLLPPSRTNLDDCHRERTRAEANEARCGICARQDTES